MNVTEKLNRVIWALSPKTHGEIKEEILNIIKSNDQLKFDDVMKIMENTNNIHNIDKARELLESLEGFIPAGEDFNEVLDTKKGITPMEKMLREVSEKMGLDFNPEMLSYGVDKTPEEFLGNGNHPDSLDYNPLEECDFLDLNTFTLGYIADIYKSLCKKIAKDKEVLPASHLFYALNCIGYVFLTKETYINLYNSILEIYSEKELEVNDDNSRLSDEQIELLFNRHNTIVFLQTKVENLPTVNATLDRISANPLVQYRIIGYEGEWAVMEGDDTIILTAATAK